MVDQDWFLHFADAYPNTSIHYPLFTQHSVPMPAGVLKSLGWERLMQRFPDKAVVEAILGICQYGVRIGYHSQRSSITIHPNLAAAEEHPKLVTEEIERELKKNRLVTY